MKKRIVLLFLAVVMLLSVAGAQADSTVNAGLKVSYGQTAARSMLEMINQFRQGSDAWYWNEDNATKTTLTSLQPLVYDYELEKTAMQRAAEVALYFAHERPNGTMCDTAFPSSYTWQGENIAAGQRSAESAFVSWQETDEHYDGQGHRRNMLSTHFNCIGIGHVVVNGTHYWTQALGYKDTPNTTETSAADSAQTVTVEIDSGKVGTVTHTPATATLELDGTMDVPTITYSLTGSWPAGKVYTLVTSDDADQPEWTGTGTGSVSVSKGKITATGVGTVTLKTSFLGKELSSAITVTPKDLSGAAVAVNDTGLIYTGKAQTPEVTVTLEGKKLTAGTDYDLTWENNTAASSAAKVTVTGKGNYKGSVSGTFAIGKASLQVTAADMAITYGDAPTGGEAGYAGFAEGEDASVLAGSLTYAYSYSQYGDAGEYTVTPAGLTSDNYAITFVPGKLTVGKKTVSLAWGGTSLPYTGSAQAPEVSVTGLVNQDAVTAAVSGSGTNAGEYTATVTGLSGAKAANYTLANDAPGTCGFTITRVDPEVTAPEKKADLTYTGSEQTLITAGSVQGGKMLYRLNSGDEWTETLPSGRDAGEYTVAYKVTGDQNHNDIAEQSLTAVIGKTAPEVTAPKAAEGLIYSGAAQNLISEGATKDGTMQYASGADDQTAPESGWGAAVPTGTDAGTYAVWYKVTGDANHSDAAAQCVSVKIAPKALSGITASMSGYAYEGTVPQPAVSDNPGKAEPAWYYSTENSNQGGTEWKNITGTSLNAGSYYLYAVIPETGNYGSFTTDPVPFTVDRAKQGIPAAPVPFSVSMNSITLTTVPGCEYRVGDGAWQSGSTFEGLERNTEYTFWQRKAEDRNHYASESSSAALRTNDRTQVALAVTMGSITYGESLPAPAYTKTEGAKETILYSGKTTAGKEYGPAADVPSDAGSYTVSVRYETESVAASGTADFTIAAADLSGAVITLGDPLIYTGEEQTQGVTAVTLNGKNLLDICTITGNKQTEIGTYTLTAAVEDNANYTGKATRQFTIAARLCTVTFAAGGGSGLMKSEIVAEGGTMPLPGNGFTPPAGYQFTGWDKGAPGTVITVTEDMTVTALWESTQRPLEKIQRSGLTEVPAALRGMYSSLTEVKNALMSRIDINGTAATTDNTAFYDVELLVSRDGGRTWQPVPADNFPAGGITVTLPYPEGTGRNTHQFKAAHMFTATSAKLGTVAGEIETPAVTARSTGLDVTLRGMSPVALSWAAVEGKGEEGKEEEEEEIHPIPLTGDGAPLVLWISLVLLGIAILTALGISKYGKKRTNRSR